MLRAAAAALGNDRKKAHEQQQQQPHPPPSSPQRMPTPAQQSRGSPKAPGVWGEGEATSTLQQQAFQVDVQQQQQQQAFQASARPGPVILNVGQSNEDFEPMESSYPSSSGRYQQPAGEGGAEVGAGAAAGPAWLAHHPKALSNLVETVHIQRQPAHAHAQYSFKKTAQVLRSVPFLRDWGGFL